MLKYKARNLLQDFIDIFIRINKNKYYLIFFTISYLLLITLNVNKALAIPSTNLKDNKLPTILKAKLIEGDNNNELIIASGDVEISKGLSVIYSDQLTYDKLNKQIFANGNLRIKNLEVGNILGSNAVFSDDFNKGTFFNSKLFFNDGSYIFSKKINRISQYVSSFENYSYSICPNPEIALDQYLAGKKSDFATITAKKTIIDRDNQKIKSNHAIFKIYNLPIIYFPYFSSPLPAKKRESGFLAPSYVKNSNFGLGIKIPYYQVISNHTDLTISPLLYTRNNQFIINNNFRQFTKYGKYNIESEIANNNVESNVDKIIINRTNKKYRWQIEGKGEFNLNKNLFADYLLNTVSDRDYKRDYHFNYSAFSTSKINFDYIKGRDYFSVKSIRFQELEDKENENSAPFILPQIQGVIETKPYFFKEKFMLSSDIVMLQRNDGLQYRRLTLVPSAKIPFNIGGNLIDFSAKLQNDLYWLENNYNLQRKNNYSTLQSNYKKEFSINWQLPLIRKSRTKTIIFEPMLSFVSSTYNKNFSKLPNEESNDGELSFSNLFVNDRISGNDRNEIGERFNFGGRASYFNSYGEFGLFSGQSYRITNDKQDVEIRGFADNNKSNIVGKTIFKAKKYFSISYLFQLNESNYTNEVNQINTNFNYKKFLISSDYLLIKKTIANSQKREQISLNSSFDVYKDWKIKLFLNHDMILKRTLSRGIILTRDGCCTTFSFSVSENNQSNLTKPQKTFNLNLSFKNL